MGIGGTSSTSHTSNPTNIFSPVAFGGGNIIAGDVGTGSVMQSGGSTAGGGSFSFGLDMKMPEIPGAGGKDKPAGGDGGAAKPAIPALPPLPVMQLQNLESWIMPDPRNPFANLSAMPTNPFANLSAMPSNPMANLSAMPRNPFVVLLV